MKLLISFITIMVLGFASFGWASSEHPSGSPFVSGNDPSNNHGDTTAANTQASSMLPGEACATCAAYMTKKGINQYTVSPTASDLKGVDKAKETSGQE